MKNKLVMIFSLALCLCIGCGSSTSSYSNYATSEEMAYAPEKSSVATDFSAEYDMDFEQNDIDSVSENGYENTNRKLIKTVNLDVETEKFDEFLATINAKINQTGGYAEEYSQYGQSNYRTANLTIRVPVKSLDDFLLLVEGESNITSKHESVEDITLQYVDLDSHKKALKTEEARLLELLEKAETVEDLLTIESRLSDLRYQINSMESQLRTYDNKVDYATVYLYVNEVVRYTPAEEISTWGRIKTGFVENLYDLGGTITDIFVWVVIYLPNLLILAIIIAIIVMISKKRKKIKKEKLTKKQSDVKKVVEKEEK